jgi:hypothetical protein
MCPLADSIDGQEAFTEGILRKWEHQTSYCLIANQARRCTVRTGQPVLAQTVVIAVALQITWVQHHAMTLEHCHAAPCLLLNDAPFEGILCT